MFSFVKRIETTKDSIFYSFINYKDELIGFGRKHYKNENKIKKIKIDERFNVIEDKMDEKETFDGEDPRCFLHENKLYITDNLLNNTKIYDYENKKHIKIHSNGKNLSFISYNNVLYFIHSTKPFRLYKTNCIDGKSVHLITNPKYISDLRYRGGTPGYPFKQNPKKFYGFGHITYDKRIENDKVLTHDIFLWIVDFTKHNNPSIEVRDIQKPENAKNICDPTCVIEINNKLYLVTAETEHAWFCEQDYITNVYEIVDKSFIDMVL